MAEPQLCAMCVFRPRHVGGNGFCPVRDDLPDCDAEANYDRHRLLWPKGCSNFKAGDLRRKPEPVPPQESLF